MDTSIDKNEVFAELKQIFPSLRLRYPLRKMALFGSVVRGDATEQSDVDILVEVDPTIGLRMVDLAEELESHLHRKVDLVSSRAIRPHMMEAIREDIQYV